MIDPVAIATRRINANRDLLGMTPAELGVVIDETGRDMSASRWHDEIWQRIAARRLAARDIYKGLTGERYRATR